MSLAAIAIGSAVVGTAANIYATDRAASAAEEGARLSAEGQQAALEYQQEVERLPLAYRDAAMQQLAGEYGLTIDEQGNVIGEAGTPLERARRSPLYEAMRDVTQQSIARTASATSGLRSGSTVSDLASADRDALLTAYQQQLQGLSGFARTPLNTANIASTMSGIGATRGQGAVAQGQIEQQGIQNILSGIGSAAQLYGMTRPVGPTATALPPPTTTGVPLNINTGYV